MHNERLYFRRVERQHDEMHHTLSLVQPTWHPVERSERNVSIDNIARIARGLQTEPWRLLKGDSIAAVMERAGRNSGKIRARRRVLEIEDCCLKLRSISKTRSILLLSRPFRRAPFPETINGKQWTELLRDYSSSVESSLCGLVLANRDVRLGGKAKHQ